MKKYLTMVCGLALTAGCQSYPEARTGWRFEVLKPPMIANAPTATAVTTGSTSGLVGMGQDCTMSGATSMGASAEFGVVESKRLQTRIHSVTPAPNVGASGCDLEDVCRRLERLERERASQPLAQPLPQFKP